jgi:hypothetical protein
MLKQFLYHSTCASITLATIAQQGFSSNVNDVGLRSPVIDGVSISPETIFLPWTSSFSRSSIYTPSIRGSISGRKLTFAVDTNSTIVLIGAPLLPKVRLTKQNAPGWQFSYSNSMLYNGQFVDRNITMYGAKSGEAVVSQVPVLVVTKVEVCPGYDVNQDNGVCPRRKLKGTASAVKLSYMGVGFGRNVSGSGLPYDTPVYNPFLNVIRHSSSATLSMRTGYIISKRGVYLGLTEDNTAGARWMMLKKMAGSDSRAWASPLVSFTHDNSNNPIQAQALIDIGVPQMYIQSTPDVSLPNVTAHKANTPAYSVQLVKPGTKLSFSFPDFKTGVAGYDFVVGDFKFPSQPAYVASVTSEPGPSVRPGRNFLYGFSVVFDAVAGRFGLICEMCK